MNKSSLTPFTSLIKNENIGRIISGLVAVPALALAIFLSRMIVNWGVDVMSVSWTGSPLMVAGLLLWYAFRGHVARERLMIQSIWKWGLITGLVGFVLGFFLVPLIATSLSGKDLPQAPLMGIFITGPAGFLIGTIIGGFIQVKKKEK